MKNLERGITLMEAGISLLGLTLTLGTPVVMIHERLTRVETKVEEVEKHRNQQITEMRGDLREALASLARTREDVARIPQSRR